jgi:hypothetical protein
MHFVSIKKEAYLSQNKALVMRASIAQGRVAAQREDEEK